MKFLGMFKIMHLFVTILCALLIKGEFLTLQWSPDDDQSHPSEGVMGSSTAIYLGIGIFVLGAALASTLVTKINNKEKAVHRGKKFEKNGGNLLLKKSKEAAHTIKIYTDEDMMKATKNHSEENIIGRCNAGTFFVGTDADKKQIMVVRIQKPIAASQIKKFVDGLIMLSLGESVNLIGCCLESDLPLLVFDCTQDDMAKVLKKVEEKINALMQQMTA